MSEWEEPTAAQLAASRELDDAGREVVRAMTLLAQAQSRLDRAVQSAHAVGIAREDVQPLIDRNGARKFGVAISSEIRTSIRNAYT